MLHVGVAEAPRVESTVSRAPRGARVPSDDQKPSAQTDRSVATIARSLARPFAHRATCANTTRTSCAYAWEETLGWEQRPSDAASLILSRRHRRATSLQPSSMATPMEVRLLARANRRKRRRPSRAPWTRMTATLYETPAEHGPARIRPRRHGVGGLRAVRRRREGGQWTCASLGPATRSLGARYALRKTSDEVTLFGGSRRGPRFSGTEDARAAGGAARSPTRNGGES